MAKCESCEGPAVKTYKLKINLSIGDRVEEITRYGAVCAECYAYLYNHVDEFVEDMVDGITKEESETLSKY